MQGSEISTPFSSVTSLSEDTLQYLDTHQHLLPGGKRPSNVLPLARGLAAPLGVSLQTTVSPVSFSCILQSQYLP